MEPPALPNSPVEPEAAATAPFANEIHELCCHSQSGLKHIVLVVLSMYDSVPKISINGMVINGLSNCTIAAHVRISCDLDTLLPGSTCDGPSGLCTSPGGQLGEALIPRPRPLNAVDTATCLWSCSIRWMMLVCLRSLAISKGSLRRPSR